MSILLMFKGEPVAKGVVQNFMVKGRVYKFLPKKTRNFFADIRAQACQQLPKDFIPYKGALKITAMFNRQKPKKPKKGGEHHPISRPDLSNYLKAIEDALNTIVWEDDAQIVEAHIQKRYDVPGIMLEIEEIA